MNPWGKRCQLRITAANLKNVSSTKCRDLVKPISRVSGAQPCCAKYFNPLLLFKAKRARRTETETLGVQRNNLGFVPGCAKKGPACKILTWQLQKRKPKLMQLSMPRVAVFNMPSLGKCMAKAHQNRPLQRSDALRAARVNFCTPVSLKAPVSVQRRCLPQHTEVKD